MLKLGAYMIKNVMKYTFFIGMAVLVGAVSFLFHMNRNAYYSFAGTINHNQIEIGTYSSGTIKDLYIREGQIVEEGELLYEIENDILMEKFNKMSKDNPNFNEPDYIELQKKIEKFKITSPSRSVVTKVHKFKGSFVKDNETLANLIPLESINYSFDFNEEFLNSAQREDILFKIQPGGDIFMKFIENYEVSAKIVSVIPDQSKPKHSKVYILPGNLEEIPLNTGQTFEVKIPKKNLIRDNLGFLLQPANGTVN